MTWWKKLLRILSRAGSVLLVLLLMATACAALILAQPQEEEETRAAQPLLSPSPALSISAEADLRELVGAFPVPVMSFMSGSGMTFVSGTSADSALEDGFGRVLTLNWQTPDGNPVILQSLYPASGLKLLEDAGFHFTPAAGPTLFGNPSVRMESADRIRVHAATETGLYAVTLPLDQAAELSAIARSLQLFTAEPAD